MDASAEMMRLAKEAYTISAKWKIIQSMREMTKMLDSTYDLIGVQLDKAEYEADEDLGRLAEVSEKRDKFKSTRSHLSDMGKSVSETEDELIPETIAFFDAMFNLGEAER